MRLGRPRPASSAGRHRTGRRCHPRRYRRGAEGQRQMMDAAQRCFAGEGFHETTLQDVFRESGLSAGAVYRYFHSKNDLVQAITAQETAPFIAIIESALAQDPVPGTDEIAGRLA